MNDQPENLAELHLAELHEQAYELEIEGFRRLRRPDLIEAIEQARTDGEQADDGGEERSRGRGGLGGLFRRRGRSEERSGREAEKGARRAARQIEESDPAEPPEPVAPAAADQEPGEGTEDEGDVEEAAEEKTAVGEAAGAEPAEGRGADAPRGETAGRDREGEGARRSRRRGGRGRRGGSRGRSQEREGGGERPRRDQRREAPDRGGHDEEREDPAGETEPVSGVLDLMPQRFGFLRLEGLEPDPDDVYVSASQVKRLELRPGDQVAGPARAPRRGERHRALIHVDTVNGTEAGASRPDFAELTPVPPSRPLPLDGIEGDEGVLVRAVDLLAPLAFGQRVLISSGQRSGRTTLLRALAGRLSRERDVAVVVLLVDERPEDATRWRRAVPDAQLAIATAEMAPPEQRRMAELATSWARRRAEAGEDVVLLVDSLTRLVAAGEDESDVKALFGSGRAFAEEEAGSLTVIATVLGGAGDPAERAVLTTENALVKLDAELAGAGIWPAVDAGRCQVSDESELRSPDQLEAIRKRRFELRGLSADEAAQRLGEWIRSSRDNAELLGG